MKKPIIALAATAAIVFACKPAEQRPVDFVDPFIGTGFHGHTYPGATTPFGAVQLSPDNYRGVWDACSGYHYDRDSIIGFSHNHLSGTGCADLADVLFHPTSKEVDLSREGDIYEHLKFSHKDESATPGYYSVYFRKDGIKAEMTATAHTGWHRYTWKKGAPHNLIIDMHHGITDEKIQEVELFQTSENEIRGMRKTTAWVPDQYIYFVAQFSRPIESIRYVDAHSFVNSAEDCSSDDRQVILSFGNEAGPVVAKVGLSNVGYDSASQNLVLEAGFSFFNFDQVKHDATESWNDFLNNKITVEGGTKAQKRIFYTAMYHTAVVPNVQSDVNRVFRRSNDKLSSTVPGHQYYSTLSLWDIFRAWLPLSSFVYPKELCDIVYSCLEMYDATGSLPLWPLSSGETECMIGYHSIPFIVDAWFKGLISDMNPEYALEAMVESSNKNAKGSNYYKDLYYIPANKVREAVSAALEYAYDDWCIAKFAEFLGKADIAAEYYKRAQSFQYVFDGSTGFMRGRNLDGSMVEPFNPVETSREYTEANAWQYRFFTPQDFKGLGNLLGGEEQFIAALDSIFTVSSETAGHVSDMTGFVGQYVHGNEPSHHITYIYNWLGQPWKTQELTRRMLNEMYQDTPEGISGNEDCGQMSAWYIMSALGLYEVCPGSLEYTLTSPLFESATINMPSGRKLTITANDPAHNPYIQSVELNGRTIDKAYVTYAQLLEGGELKFNLGKQPNKELWTAKEARPASITTDENPLISPVWYTVEGGRIDLFLEHLTMTLGSRTEGTEIHYTVDGSEPTLSSPLYTAPFTMTETTTVRAKAFKDGRESIEFKTTAQKCHYIESTAGKFTQNGVNYKYYTGDFSCTDDILKLGTFVKEGTLEYPVLDPAEQEDYYGLIYTGYLNIPSTGVWKFGLLCDDGGLLQIDGRDAVDNDGTHSATMMRGFIPLEAGIHPFTLKYIESYEGEELSIYWERDGKWEIIPAENFFIK
ncbi:MAG: GH92 family glycosyl hydrolase [Bacteroidales bacterium]|nr:GH92 family glycosyl hydrolase [Bacteroidales bacterium]